MESLLKQALPHTTEILVVDNASSDRSVSFLRSDFPEIEVIAHENNLGLAAGVNSAIKRARGKYYLILNPDMIALPGSVQALTDFMDENSEVGIVGGKLIHPNGKLQYSSFRFYRPVTVLFRRTFLGRTGPGKREVDRFLMKDVDHTQIQEVDWLMGACLMVRAGAVDEVGGMDDRFFLYFEDVDWCRRMWEAGWKVMFVPKAVFSHFYQKSSQRGSVWGWIKNRAAREHIKSAIKYFWKFRGRPAPVRG